MSWKKAFLNGRLRESSPPGGGPPDGNPQTDFPGLNAKLLRGNTNNVQFAPASDFESSLYGVKPVTSDTLSLPPAAAGPARRAPHPSSEVIEGLTQHNSYASIASAQRIQWVSNVQLTYVDVRLRV